MKIPLQHKMQELIQEFTNEIIVSEEFQQLFGNDAELTEEVLNEAFDYLDIKCQQKLRNYMLEEKNEQNTSNLNNDNDVNHN